MHYYNFLFLNMTTLIIIIVALILYVGWTYNSFIQLRQRVKEGWSDIDVQLKRRYNLIPNIVESVKGYAAHEEGVLTKVTEARSNAINAGNVHDQAAAENMLSGALKSLFAVSENYPELKANENFLQLQNELVDTEDKIQASRRFYNGIVRTYNTKTKQVPANILANLLKFQEEEFFEIEEEQKENVQVSFNKEEVQPEPTPVEEPIAEPVVEPTPVEEPVAEPTPTEPVVESVEPSTEGEVTEPRNEEGGEEKPIEPTPVVEPEVIMEVPVEEPDVEQVVEPVVEEKPEESKPTTCPKCGGEMTEGHTCPIAEPVVEEKPIEPTPVEEPVTEPTESKDVGAADLQTQEEGEEKPIEPTPTEEPSEPSTEGEATEPSPKEEGEEKKEEGKKDEPNT